MIACFLFCLPICPGKGAGVLSALTLGQPRRRDAMTGGGDGTCSLEQGPTGYAKVVVHVDGRKEGNEAILENKKVASRPVESKRLVTARPLSVLLCGVYSGKPVGRKRRVTANLKSSRKPVFMRSYLWRHTQMTTRWGVSKLDLRSFGLG